jgi:hypothetical protein
MTRRTFSIGAALAALCLAAGSQRELQAAVAPSAKAAETGFVFKSAKPYTRWWWFAQEIKKEDIDAQLQWLKDNNFGGVEIAWVYPPRPKFWAKLLGRFGPGEAPAAKWLSPEWSQLVAYAKQKADTLGLGCDFTFGSGWPFGDTGVTKDDAVQFYGQPDYEQRIKYLSWESPAEPLVLNHLDRKAFARYAQRMGQALAPALAGSRSSLFCDSWEVETRGLWTRGFGKTFLQRFGYDIRPFMDSIYEDRDPSGLRYDYMKLISQYVLTEFYQPFAQTCRKLGASSRVQAHGSPTDLITAYALFDVPETEAVLFAPAFGRIAASAAALASRREVSAETFTCLYGFLRKYHGQEQTADLKLVADAMFANGVNQIVWHGTPFTRKDARHDGEFYATVHVGREGALAKDLPAFNAYLEKVSAIMKRGRTYSDLAVYLPLEDSWAESYESYGYELRGVRIPEEVQGYHPLWINNEFLKRGAMDQGRLRVGDLSFAALYVDVSYLDAETLDTITRLAKAGLPVCLKGNPQQAGRIKSAAFPRTLQELFALKNVSRDPGKFLARKPLVAGKDIPDYWARVDDGDLIIFFAHPKTRRLWGPLRLGQSFTDDDLTRDVTIGAGGRALPVRLVFKPYQSILLKIGKDGGVTFLDIAYQPPPAVPTLLDRMRLRWNKRHPG